MVPALYMPAIVLWIAFKASLCTCVWFSLVYLHQFFELHFLDQILGFLLGVQSSQSFKADEFGNSPPTTGVVVGLKCCVSDLLRSTRSFALSEMSLWVTGSVSSIIK